MVVLGVGATLFVAAHFAAWSLPAVQRAWLQLAGPGQAPDRLVANTVVLLCAGAMVVLALWLAASVVVCLADRRSGTDPADRRGLFRPRLVRALVAGAVGTLVAVSASGAGATRGPDLPHVLDGLPLPDRSYGGVRTHPVLPGESLWSITAEHLAPRTDTRTVARAWPRLHRLNRDRLGTDPHLIRPGTTLRLPTWRHRPTRGATP